MKLYHEERMGPIKEAFEADVLLMPDVNPRKMIAGILVSLKSSIKSS